MTLTLLLDLDDTLLNTNQETFIPAYFQALAKELAPQIAPNVMLRALLAATALMNESGDFSRTLKEVFESEFIPQVGVSQNELDPAIENFYDRIFPTLQGLTSPKPEAKLFVEWALAQGFRVAIATDPLLPRKATNHRLRWAGFEPEQFELVSSFEHFHFSKTHSAYYAEVLGRMGWADGPVLMAGNDMERDIIPAKKLGLATYYVNGKSASPEKEARGTLSDLRAWIESANLDALIPSFKSVDSVLGILSATPAAMNGLARGRDLSSSPRESTPDDWSFAEVACHLRDTEREIHHLQIKL
ncbi:MAG: HAD hydrolase-like protein, partial [Anaerolineales bacterium]|nr:HAD hydrolase-like protein [Anaerolineales bacterium]